MKILFSLVLLFFKFILCINLLQSFNKRLQFLFFLGCKDKALAPILRDCIQTPNFRVVVVEDCEAVEVCGALKVN